MAIIDKIKEAVFGTEEDIEMRKGIKSYKKKLDMEYKKKFMKAEMDKKLKDIKSGKEVKTSGIASLGKSLMKASEKMSNYDFQGGSTTKKDYGKDMFK